MENYQINHYNSVIVQTINLDHTIFETLFNLSNKQLQLYILDKNKTIKINIIVGPLMVNQESDLWYNIHRPILKTHFNITQNINLLDNNQKNVTKTIIYNILKYCRDNNIIKFDTDKDFRRAISLSLNCDWYPYPG